MAHETHYVWKGGKAISFEIQITKAGKEFKFCRQGRKAIVAQGQSEIKGHLVSKYTSLC
jgi:hypothetical protein